MTRASKVVIEDFTKFLYSVRGNLRNFLGIGEVNI